MDLKKLARDVAHIARQAGEAILEVYAQAEGMEIERKSDDSPLTLADRRSNAVICAGLEQLTHRFPIVSEENKEIPFEQRRTYEFHWLVDPLDGTKEFIKRNGEFTVNIALIHKDHPVLGVVYVPVTDELYWAGRGVGAYLIQNGREQRIRSAEFQLHDSGLHLVCSRSHLNEETQAFVDRFQAPELVSKGSSLKFLLLAKGEAHVYPRLAPTMEWDTGAAQVILEEAGGQVIDENTGRSLRYNKEVLLNPSFVAYGTIVES
ncbi:MAG: 3'(2'),5'-bisphosphate nucleotidase CysQ [Saprospiraceae bacterium]|nr:3'(2'),5'-bisphosphate nucleotidase CysQ [Saprospiraceae bacterium]MCB0623215.1 3'(2'),5'-bisphosphate nucleotidase CysQ [Saprospiraceae bacterium]MCB0678150.1 3'(2'),5'-bisphosphate nucleotidase CysQ [Saprospiraceae bacterium]MCB0681113.1 3'(2'),5'-bisphosphate nucleotidase CysQ [Saprospiraceae bacterium]